MTQNSDTHQYSKGQDSSDLSNHHDCLLVDSEKAHLLRSVADSYGSETDTQAIV
ncbi:hypothetical protein BaRGS_00034737, partial [Batillaria attramentaria]